MPKFFSPSTLGFYDDTLHEPGSIPSDAVAVTDAEYAALLEAQAAGKVFAVVDNRVVAQDPPPPDQDMLLAALRRTRDRLLRDSDFTQIPDAPLSAEERAAWADYRQALRDLPELYGDDPAAAVWPTPPNQETFHG